MGVVTADDAQAALSYWSDVRVAQHAAFWTVSGVDPSGVARSGSRDDLASLVADLLAFQGLESQEIAPDAEQDNDEPARHDASNVEHERLSFEALASRGIMLVEDELMIRRGLALERINNYAEALLSAITDPNRRVEMAALVASINNKRSEKLPITDEDEAIEAEWYAAPVREAEITNFAKQLREAVRFASVDMLRDFNVEGAGWPT